MRKEYELGYNRGYEDSLAGCVDDSAETAAVLQKIKDQKDIVAYSEFVRGYADGVKVGELKLRLNKKVDIN